jgi:tRNA(fMet)-specific endonuclease VapC
MNGICLLDTNIVVSILNQEVGIEQRLQGMSVVIPSIVLGELYFGARRSARVEENLRRIEAFIAGYPILACDKATAEEYSRVKQRLTAKGRPLPENDIWIAAVARQHGLTLITHDKHFAHVDGLSVENG